MRDNELLPVDHTTDTSLRGTEFDIAPRNKSVGSFFGSIIEMCADRNANGIVILNHIDN